MYHFRKSLRSLAVSQIFCTNNIPKFIPSYSYLLYQYECRRHKRTDINLSSLFIPVPVKPIAEDDGIGKELTGNLSKSNISKVLNKFYQRPEVKLLSAENGLDSMYLLSFFLLYDTMMATHLPHTQRRYCKLVMIKSRRRSIDFGFPCNPL